MPLWVLWHFWVLWHYEYCGTLSIVVLLSTVALCVLWHSWVPWHSWILWHSEYCGSLQYCGTRSTVVLWVLRHCEFYGILNTVALWVLSIVALWVLWHSNSDCGWLITDGLERIQHGIIVVQARIVASMVWNDRGRTWSLSVNIADDRTNYECLKTTAVSASCAALLFGAEVQNIPTDIHGSLPWRRKQHRAPKPSCSSAQYLPVFTPHSTTRHAIMPRAGKLSLPDCSPQISLKVKVHKFSSRRSLPWTAS